MKVKVLFEFRDKFDFAKVYSVGSEYEFAEARAKEIVERGLGELVKPIETKDEPKEAEPMVEEAKEVKPRTRKSKKSND